MKASYNWLREFIDFPHSPEELAEVLTGLGHTVDGIEPIGAKWTKVVVGKVVECKPVVGSDHLSECLVSTGDACLSSICGAPNVAKGQVVPFALPGATLPGGFVVSERKMRGILSQGVICSERELGLSDDHRGILVLPENLPLGAPLERFLGLQDWIYDLDLTFSRPDCLSHLGLARDVAAKLGLSLKIPDIGELKLKTSDGRGLNKSVSEYLTVDILAIDDCPRYSARLVNNVKVGPSPLWLQERLRNLGVRAISNIVDATNYVMLELGHPLHAFDYHLVEDAHIIVRKAEDGERFITLDEKEHILTRDDLLISDPHKGVALAGVMGGLNSEIKDDTKDVLIECAYFNPLSIYHTSRRHNITSESSRRFERGVDPEMTLFGATRTAFMIQQLAGGEIAPEVVDAYPKVWQPHTILLNPERANQHLATNLETSQMIGYLTALGCRAEEQVREHKSQDKIDVNSCKIVIYIPSWRADITCDADLFEEIARLYGYNNIPTAQMSQIPLKVDLEREHFRKIEKQIRNILVSLGCYEAVSWTFVPLSDAKKLNLNEDTVEILNPISEDMATMRTSILPTLLRTAQRNRNNGVENIRLFEWGRIYRRDGNSVVEQKRLTIVLAGKDKPSSWQDEGKDIDFYYVKGLASSFLERIALDKFLINCYVKTEQIKMGGMIEGLDGSKVEPIGLFGQVNPKFAEKFGVEFPIWCIDLDGDKLIKLAGKTAQYKPLPRFPAVHRDLAFIVKSSVKQQDFAESILKNGGNLLSSLELFDVYSGTGIPEGCKSLAYHLTYRDANRTLSDQEVDVLISSLIKALTKEYDAVLRDKAIS